MEEPIQESAKHQIKAGDTGQRQVLNPNRGDIDATLC